MSGSNSQGQYSAPTFGDVNLVGFGSVLEALETAEEITPEQLEAVWAQETITGGEW